MAVHIQLDKNNSVYTNLDNISGKAILAIQREEAFSAIVVKLECESRTKLAAPNQRRRRDYDVELECHKLLYKTITVFPTPGLVQASPQGASYTLTPGHHAFPFQFKVPFNNACAPINSIMAMGQDFNQHIKRPLPPSLSGFPGEAEIRYYLKVTAQRAAFYKENFRTELNFKFLPLEPPRKPSNRRESYARRQHQFAPPLEVKQKIGILGRSTLNVAGPPPTISLDGRLPDPAIITCNEPLPLRVLVRKLNKTTEIVYLQTFQILLIGYTKIRAHDLEQTEQSTWVICSSANLQTPLGNSNTAANEDIELDSKMWVAKPLPNTVCPTFETCNLSRYYVLEIKVGLVYGTPGNIKPELTVQPLRMPVQVYSGIKPPEALVNEMAKRKGAAQGVPSQRPPAEDRLPAVSTPAVTISDQLTEPVQASQHNEFSTGLDLPDEPPPSYEDAMAEDLAPADGPRSEYEQATPAAGSFAGTDSKRDIGF